jgi:hypothetical protein
LLRSIVLDVVAPTAILPHPATRRTANFISDRISRAVVTETARRTV